MSPYVRELRARMGAARLLLPSVTALVFDDAGRLLLVRQRDGGVWSTPGGAMELGESPADAMVREVWEETGLLVEPLRIAGVYGGSECVVRYPNGDETQYVMTVFDCAVRGGALRADGDETLEARYVGAGEARALPLTPWLRHVIGRLFERREGDFVAARWRPGGES